MTPTLEGRVQTRLFLAITVGVVWTAIIAPFLPEPAGVTVTMSYAMAFASLLLMTVYGLVWEYFYQALQQGRWDKDWPSVFMLLTVLNEAPVVWLLDHLFPVMSGPMAGMASSLTAQAGSVGPDSPYLPGFLIHIGTTWALIWLFSEGPMRVIFIRWRFEGGRIISLPATQDPADDPRYRGPVLARSNGALAAIPRGERVEGSTCGHGHFGHQGMRFCLTCGVMLPPVASVRSYGPRPPLGILIFEDGATHVLDGDARLALFDIRIAGWQPMVSSEVHRIVLALPDGKRLHVEPGASARLMPGTEVTVAGRRIRYESPYQPVNAGRPAQASTSGREAESQTGVGILVGHHADHVQDGFL